MTELIDLKVFLKQYEENPEKTKLSMIRRVMDDIQEDIDYRYYDNLSEDLCPPDYGRICDNVGWPDFQDGGLFEQCIDIACDMMLQIYGYRPLNCLKRYEKNNLVK